MSIEQEKVVDLIADEKDSNTVVLFITDHLSWDDPKGKHLFKLQEKINSYLSFIEIGFPKIENKNPSL